VAEREQGLDLICLNAGMSESLASMALGLPAIGDSFKKVSLLLLSLA